MKTKIISTILLVVGMLTATLIVTYTWKSIARSQQTIAVIGSAKTNIVSDLAVLKGSILLQVAESRTGIAQVNPQMEVVMNYLLGKGIKKSSIEIMPITQFANYEYTSQGYPTAKVLSYSVSQRFQLTSTNVSLIKQLSLEIPSLIEKGISLQMEMPEYYFTHLADIKISIQSLAAKDAQLRAQAMAEATGQTLGAMRSAKMGVLQITPKNSNIISDYGMNDVTSIEKEVTAVIHTSFEID